MFLLNLSTKPFKEVPIIDLHPIMFLLNPLASRFSDDLTICTSHYVPIKSAFHSVHLCILVAFTSHYVPIKSLKNNLLNVQISLFTSHYVPIKSLP